MVKLNIFNSFKEVKIPRKKLRRLLEDTLEVLGKNSIQGRLEFFIVDDKEIQALNKEYRGKDKVTDVLSFGFSEEIGFPGENLIGQIFLAWKTVKKQAFEHGWTFEEELLFLFVHGLLHVFGFDHENLEDFEEMFGLHARIMPDEKWRDFIEQIKREAFLD